MNRSPESAAAKNQASAPATSLADSPFAGTTHVGPDAVSIDPSSRPPGPTYTRYIVLVWLCAAATVAYVSRNCLGVAEKTIRTDLGLTEREMGFAMSAFFWSYAVVQIPTGWLADRLGSRLALTLFSVVWSLATALAAVATFGRDIFFELPFAGMVFGPPLLILCTSRFINGIAQAGLFPGSTNTISKWFSKHDRAFPSGALASFMSLGGAGGGILAGWLLGTVGMRWEWLFIAFGLPGILWAVGYYAWFRDTPAEHPSVSEEELRGIEEGQPVVVEPSPKTAAAAAGSAKVSVKKSAGRTPWLAMMSSPAMWWICGQQFFRAAAYIFFASWFPTYLQETRGVSLEKSAFLTALPLFAVVIGSLVGGGLSDVVLRRTNSRRLARQGVAVVTLLICASMIVGAYFIENAVLAVVVISLGTLFYALGGPVGYAITMDMGDKHVATVFSTMNMSGNLGAALFPLVVTEFRILTSWESVLLLFAAMFASAAVCWTLLKPDGSVFDQSLVRYELED